MLELFKVNCPSKLEVSECNDTGYQLTFPGKLHPIQFT